MAIDKTPSTTERVAHLVADALQEYPRLISHVVVNSKTFAMMTGQVVVEKTRAGTLLNIPVFVNDQWPLMEAPLLDGEVGFASRFGGLLKREFVHPTYGDSMAGRRQRRGDGRGGKSVRDPKIGMSVRIAGGSLAVGQTGKIVKIYGDRVDILGEGKTNPIKGIPLTRLQEWYGGERSRPPIGLLLDRLQESCHKYFEHTMAKVEFAVVTPPTLHVLMDDAHAQSRAMSTLTPSFTKGLEVITPFGVVQVVSSVDERVRGKCLERVDDYEVLLVPEQRARTVKFSLWTAGVSMWDSDTDNKITTQKLMKDLFASRKKKAGWDIF